MTLSVRLSDGMTCVNDQDFLPHIIIPPADIPTVRVRVMLTDLRPMKKFGPLPTANSRSLVESSWENWTIDAQSLYPRQGKNASH